MFNSSKLHVYWRTTCLIQFAVLLCVYTYLGLTPHPENSVPMFNDKLMHSGGYFAAAFSISFAFPNWKFLTRGLFLVFYGIGIEIGQHFMPPRTADFFDVCANSTGVAVGLLCVYVLRAWLIKRWNFYLFD